MTPNEDALTREDRYRIAIQTWARMTLAWMAEHPAEVEALKTKTTAVPASESVVLTQKDVL